MPEQKISLDDQHAASAKPQIRQLLLAAEQKGLPRLEAQMLMLHALGRRSHERAWLLTHETESLDQQQTVSYQELVSKRLAHYPVSQLLGYTHFYGLQLAINAHVLDPRPDTETLVDWALDVLPAHKNCTVLDLGTGSGAIALAIASQRPQAQVWASDISAQALSLAQGNAQRLGLEIHFLQSHWLQAFQTRRFDLIVSNPPYIACQDPHLLRLEHEPAQALISGQEGLDDLRAIIGQAPASLKPDAFLLLEHGWQQAMAVRKLLTKADFMRVETRKDCAGMERCTGGQIRAKG